MNNKFKSLIVLALCLILSLALVGCGSGIVQIPVDEPQTVNITVVDGTGNGIYNIGSTVVLTATPEDDQKFDGWYDGSTLVSSSTTYEFTAETDKSLTAKYSAKYASLTILGGGYEQESGLTATSVERGKEITVVAKEDQNKSFKHFLVDGKQVTTNPYKFTADADLTITTVYANTYLIFAENATIDGASQSEGKQVTEGTAVTIKYVALEGSNEDFLYWYTMDGSTRVKLGETETYTFTPSSTMYILAAVGEFRPTVTVIGGTISGTSGSLLEVAKGESVTVVAGVAESGKQFDYWANESGVSVSINSTYTFNVESNITLTAVYGDLKLAIPYNMDANKTYFRDDNNNIKFINTSDYYTSSTEAGYSGLFGITDVDFVRLHIYTNPDKTVDSVGYIDIKFDYSGYGTTASVNYQTTNHITSGNDSSKYSIYGGMYGQGRDVYLTGTATSNTVATSSNNFGGTVAQMTSLVDVIADAVGSSYSATQDYYFALQLIAKVDAENKDSVIYDCSRIAYYGDLSNTTNQTYEDIYG